MRILHVIPSFYPATYWGGPIFSVYGLCNAFARNPGCQIRVLTTDTAGPRLSERVDVTEVPTRYPAGYDVFFTRRILGREISPGLLWRLWPMVRWADVVHLTGTYSFPTMPTLLMCRLLKKPLVWSPRGALMAAKQWNCVRKPYLKKIWEIWCSVLMPKRCMLHVTSEEEWSASISRLRGAKAALIPNGVEIPFEVPVRNWLPGGCLRLLYLGRLDPIKGIENLLEAVATLDAQVFLTICGAGDEQYTRRILALVDGLGIEKRVKFLGEVQGEKKSSAFWNSDICVVPSFSENFGMVVAEALGHGVPVVASQGTPWAKLELHECGLWVENTPEALAEAIRRMRTMNLTVMGQKGREWMRDEFHWDAVSKRMLLLYRTLLNGAA